MFRHASTHSFPAEIFDTPLLVTMINALVLSRLNCCLSVHAWLPASILWRLQWVLHASARLIQGVGRHEHVILLLHELQCTLATRSKSHRHESGNTRLLVSHGLRPYLPCRRTRPGIFITRPKAPPLCSCWPPCSFSYSPFDSWGTSVWCSCFTSLESPSTLSDFRQLCLCFHKAF